MSTPGNVDFDAISAALVGYLPGQRWFGDKGRVITRVELADAAPLESGGERFSLALFRVTFDRGEPATYFIPLSFTNGFHDRAEVIVTISDPEPVDVVNALHTAAFRDWLVTSMAATDSIPARAGTFASSAPTAVMPPLSELQPSRVVTAQQSNSSVIHGSKVISKVIRRISPGINPEVEIGRFLTSRTTFRNAPKLYGDIGYAAPGFAGGIAVAQELIEATGDAWEYLQEQLPGGEDSVSMPPRLGTITAEMHIALGSYPWDRDFAPEPIAEADVQHWTTELERSVEATSAMVRQQRESLSGEAAELADLFLELAPRLAGAASGFQHLLRKAKTRVHGDYHLGQVLHATDGDYFVVDFEGEPLRPVEERRQKTSPLKDVAGMLRSFAYARGAAGQGAGPETRAALVSWERNARKGFLDAYLGTCRAASAPHLPTSDEEVRQALTAWEVDKALYEVRYEVSNRPDWLWLPLSSVLKHA